MTEVGGVVQACLALLAAGCSGEVYNVCSGHGTAIRAVLERLATLSGVEIAIEQDPARLRKAEQRRMCGNPAKLKRATGWKAITPLDDSLAEMLRYWESVEDECPSRH